MYSYERKEKKNEYMYMKRKNQKKTLSPIWKEENRYLRIGEGVFLKRGFCKFLPRRPVFFPNRLVVYLVDENVVYENY